VEGFRVPSGTLIVEGPNDGHDLICAIGLDCAIDEIMGLNLRPQDRITIFLECGAGEPTEKLPGTGVASTTSTGAASKKDFAFILDSVYPENMVRSVAGIYRLCFCRPDDLVTGDDCNSGPDAGLNYHARVGLITIRGPQTDNEITCILGEICLVPKLRGVNLYAGDKVLLMLECGTAYLGKEANSPAYPGLPLTSTPLVSPLGDLSFGMFPISGADVVKFGPPMNMPRICCARHGS